MRLYLGRDPETKKVRLREQTVRGTKGQAERILAEWLTEVGDRSVALAASSMTVAQLLDRWLEQAEADFSPKTVLETKGFARRTIVPAIGSRRVTEVTTPELDAFYLRLRRTGGTDGKGLSPSTIRRVHGIVRRAFTQAVRWGIIRYNPAVGASPPRVPKPTLHPPSPEQVAEIFAVARTRAPDFATFVLLAASTGARRGEVLALRWNDVDLDGGSVVIRRGIVLGENGLVEKDTKTHQARRLSLDPTTVAALREHQAGREAVASALGAVAANDSYVFSPSPVGSVLWHPNHISRVFREVADQAGAPQVRLHDLRHYVATRLLAAGVDIRTVAGRLGHRDPSTTLNVYAHFIPESDQQAAAVLGDMLDAALAARRG